MSCSNQQCRICELRTATQVTGDDFAIKREFDRIEQTAKRKNQTNSQIKTPSAVTDGV